MHILNMAGELLANFDKYDVRSVWISERWIKHNGFIIWKVEIINNETFVIVRPRMVHSTNGGIYNV